VPDIDGLRALIARLGGTLDPGRATEYRGFLRRGCSDQEGNAAPLLQRICPKALPRAGGGAGRATSHGTGLA
jgi:hypothetical protein